MNPLLQVSELSVVYSARHGRNKAVAGVSFDVRASETVGLVGESGSGKSSIARAVLGLVKPSAGRIVFDGTDLATLSARARRLRTRDLQAIFQDPYSSLNPTRTIGSSLAEPLLVHGGPTRSSGVRAANQTRVRELLERVDLPAEAADRYPAQFSGGQRQRIAIARALVLAPKLLICDEPVSALDLSVQAQVLNLLARMQREFALSYLFISHDLAVVRQLSHRVIVLRRGEIVEQGSADQVYSAPQHPYTQALLAAAPVPDPAVQYGRSLRVVGEGPGPVTFEG
jgi:ABC-type glutathione transport system ATPase component